MYSCSCVLCSITCTCISTVLQYMMCTCNCFIACHQEHIQFHIHKNPLSLLSPLPHPPYSPSPFLISSPLPHPPLPSLSLSSSNPGCSPICGETTSNREPAIIPNWMHVHNAILVHTLYSREKDTRQNGRYTVHVHCSVHVIAISQVGQEGGQIFYMSIKIIMASMLYYSVHV